MHVHKKKKNTLWPLFMDGVQLPQGYSHFKEGVYFYHSVPRNTFCLNFLSYPYNLPNPCSLPGSSAINLNWTLKHIILEIFEMKFLKLVSSYYCLTKTLIKSVHTKVVCISQNMLGYSFAVKSSNYHISDKSKIHMKNNRLNYF